jgi:HprK-related kinase A
VTRLGVVPEAVLRAQFRAGGVRLRVAGLCINLRTDLPAVIEQIQRMYKDHPIETGSGIDDYRLRLTYASPLRRFVGRRAQVFVEDEAPFFAMPYRAAYLLFEGALNACINQTATDIILHAAAVERDGLAVILPAPSTSGKSTLCAALVMRGWRLLSDEHGVLRSTDGRLQPIARPISLKNKSIGIIRQWAPDGTFSPVFNYMPDGDIAFLRPPSDSIVRATETARPALIVSPTYRAGVPVTRQPLGKSETFRLLVDNCINYHTTQRCGFDAIAGLVDSCAAYRLSYGTLEQAVDAMEALLARVRTDPAASRPTITTA